MFQELITALLALQDIILLLEMERQTALQFVVLHVQMEEYALVRILVIAEM